MSLIKLVTFTHAMKFVLPFSVDGIELVKAKTVLKKQELDRMELEDTVSYFIVSAEPRTNCNNLQLSIEL